MPPRSATNKKKARAGYMISSVAELYKLHPQTLRLYERVGLLKPSRSTVTVYSPGVKSSASQ